VRAAIGHRSAALQPAGRDGDLLLTVLARSALALLSAAALAVHVHTPANWNPREQRAVLRAGVMHDLGGSFDGAAPLSDRSMSIALAAIAARERAPVHVAAAGPLSVVRFDALLDDQLGLRRVAAHVELIAQRAGLHPPSYFGTEVVARYAGLRDSHPIADAAIDLYPTDPITRAEAAHSFAVVLRDGWAVAATRAALRTFRLPRYSSAQRAVLSIAVAKIGMPYVWGGTTDNTADGLAHGGYDCSGFIWRVYKVSGLPWGRQIGGRTAAAQAGEIPMGSRIRMRDVAPGDLLFFGSAHLRSTATEANIVHEGLALGDGWVIHSSDQGVYVQPLTSGWLHQSFAWARRVLS